MGDEAGETGDDQGPDARRTLGHALVTLRKKAGISLAQLAEDTGYERSYLNRLETGSRFSRRTVMEDLDTYYETDGLLVQLWEAARHSVIANQFKLFMQYEEQAVVMRKYMFAIPGLLQTENFARVILSSTPTQRDPEWIESQVSLRMTRQEVLHRDDPPHLRVIFDESALRRPTVDRLVWTEQLDHLLELAQRPNIVLQVLPFSAGMHDLTGGSLSLLWLPDGAGVAYLEGNKMGDIIEDAAGVYRYRLSYDYLRDAALSPTASLDFIREILKGEKA